MIRHGHWYINGRRVDIPSYQLREDDVITLKPNAPVDSVIRDATELTSVVPAWLQADHDGLTAKVLRLPEREEIATPVQEQLIVENSCATPSMRTLVTAAPASDDSSTRRSELPNV